MTPSRTRIPAALLGGLAAVAFTATPAQAEVASSNDATRDVLEQPETGGPEPRPGVENGDVRRLTVDHKARKVVLRATFRDLARNVDSIEQYIAIETPDDQGQLQVSAGPGTWAGTLSSGCPNADHELDYADDVFTLSLPRTCLGNPRWVRVGLGTVTQVGDRSRLDDALRDNEVRNNIKMTERLSRG